MAVEFLPAEDVPDGTDEPPRARRPRWWLPLGAALVIAAGTAWALTRPHSGTPAPVSTPPPAPAQVAKPVPECRGVPDCAVRQRVPNKLADAVRQALPGTRSVRVHSFVALNSMTGGSLLVRRDIEVTAGSVSLVIRVQRGGNGVRELVHAPPGVGSLLLHTDASGYTVRLQYLAPETVPPMIVLLRQLTRDPRLESL